jgi:flagellar motor switch protein FliG
MAEAKNAQAAQGDKKAVNVGDSLNQAAIFLMALGELEAAEILKHLGPKEVQRIGAAMARLHNVSREEVEAVLGNFINEVRHQTNLGVGTESFIRNVLKQALGEERSRNAIDKILLGGNTSGLDTLKWMDARGIADLIRFEHPQIQAIVLAYLEPDQAASVFKFLDERVRLDLMLRISSIDTIQPQALQELNDIFEKQFSSSTNNPSAQLGGIKCAANIMNFLEASAESQLIEGIKEVDEDIAQQIQDLMFVFENLKEIDNKGIQALLREVSSETLVIALKGADEEMRDKVFSNMSKRAAEMLKDDLSSRGPVKISDVEKAQKEILTTARRLAEMGEIILGGKGEEMV